MLPETYWSQPHFAVHGICVPCLELGGDYLGQFQLPQGHSAFVVADVCGKGIPAALLAAVLQGALAAEIRSERPLGEIVERVNRVICELTPTADFISMLCCVLAPDGELTYVNAGHCPLLWITESGTESLLTKGLVLGVEESQTYQEGRIHMQPGDLALLYSDGVVEADGPGGEFYGEERLLSRIAGCRGMSPAEVAQRVLDSVESFRGDQPVTDDITLLVLQYQGDADGAAGEEVS